MFWVQMHNQTWRETEPERYKWIDSIGLAYDSEKERELKLAEATKLAQDATQLHKTPHRVIMRVDMEVKRFPYPTPNPWDE